MRSRSMAAHNTFVRVGYGFDAGVTRGSHRLEAKNSVGQATGSSRDFYGDSNDQPTQGEN